jgi:hypothetical protein
VSTPPTPTRPLDALAASQQAGRSRLALILDHAAVELHGAARLTDQAHMYDEARTIASRILAACPIE